MKYLIIPDLFNKGPLVEQELLLDFIHINLDLLILIKGNHEENLFISILKYKESICSNQSFCLTDYVASYYSNHFLEIAIADPNIQKKFLTIYEKMYSIYKNKDILCTHSPCLSKHIINNSKEVTMYRFPFRKSFPSNIHFEKFMLNFFHEITSSNDFDQFQFFGHIEVGTVVKNNRQIWLDTKSSNILTIATLDNSTVSFFNEFGIENRVYHSSSSLNAAKFIFKEISHFLY